MLFKRGEDLLFAMKVLYQKKNVFITQKMTVGESKPVPENTGDCHYRYVLSVAKISCVICSNSLKMYPR